jgi:hypothetical protein
MPWNTKIIFFFENGDSILKVNKKMSGKTIIIKKVSGAK